MSHHFSPRGGSSLLGLALTFVSVTSFALSQSAPAPKPSPPSAAAPTKPTDVRSSNAPRYDIMKLCDVMVSQNSYTLVPKRSVLFASPERQQAIGGASGKAQFQQWPKFLGSNLSWISTYEVTLDQARGTAPIHPDVMKTIQQRGGVVIAVYRGCPISVATPAAPADQVAEATKTMPR